MIRVVRCAGAPRDLGLDQGRALRESLRASSRWTRELLPGSRSARAWRDLQSYFPHHAERLLGLSLGAGLPTRALAARLADLLAGDGGLAAALSGERAPGALVARSFGPATGEDLVLRHSTPDNDYRTLELAPAWGVGGVIGVNEHGLAATASALPADDAWLGGCAAPATLLVQDVLQRFDAVEKAVEWALRRPAGGCVSLLLADASGGVAAVGIEGRKRRIVGEGEAFLSGLGPYAAVAALEKAGRETRSLDATSFARLLGEASATPALVAVADPVGRRLGLAHGDAALDWHRLGASAGTGGR